MELLRHSPNLTCIGAYETAAQAEREIPRQDPDVVLMDINLGGDSGICCVARLKQAHPPLQFLMLTTYDDSELIFKSLRAGASGYLLKRAAGVELLAAIEEGHRGGSPMSMQIARKVISHFQQRVPGGEDEDLTEREAEILRMLIKGLTSPRIATQLGISHGVVRAHLHAIYSKLHVRARAEASARFLGELPGSTTANGAETSERCTAPRIGPNGLYRDPKR